MKKSERRWIFLYRHVIDLQKIRIGITESKLKLIRILAKIQYILEDNRA